MDDDAGPHVCLYTISTYSSHVSFAPISPLSAPPPQEAKTNKDRNVSRAEGKQNKNKVLIAPYFIDPVHVPVPNFDPLLPPYAQCTVGNALYWYTVLSESPFLPIHIFPFASRGLSKQIGRG